VKNDNKGVIDIKKAPTRNKLIGTLIIKCIRNNRNHRKNTYRSSNGNSNRHRSIPNRNSNRVPF
jgi:hypothetical protein